MEDSPFQIVGIAAADFRSNGEVDMWTPLRPSRTGEGSGINYTIIGRLRPGVTWSQAQSETQSIGEGIIQQRRLRAGVTQRFQLMRLQDAVTESIRTPLLLILAATGLVLVIGCVNIAGMLLARGAARSS